MLTIGIDAGTSKWAISVLEEYKEKEKAKAIFKYEITIPTKQIKSNVRAVIKLIKLIKNFNADCIILPSGYGLPLKHISKLSDDDLFKISLKNKDDKESIGIRKFLDEIKKINLNGYVIPSIKHLPTVEDFKKVNVIDLGTSDKLYSAVYALSLSKNFKAENFILAEIGYGFNAFVKVYNGKICDGIGGTIASSGFLAHGRTDSEINHNIDKFSGGVLSIINQKLSPKKFFKDYKNENKLKYNLAYNYFIDGIIKDISALLDLKISKIYFCGKISGFVEEEVKRRLEERFGRKFVIENIENIENDSVGSSASRGGAILANGIAGGKFKNLINWMKIKDAKGDIFDYIFI